METDNPERVKTIAVRLPANVYDRAIRCINNGGAMNISDLIRSSLESRLEKEGY
ncbi:MAG: hypothetical protein IJT54_05850 [Candidatus Methanomethylophilaceae archaeon]|nr:hypothetical protein [Candidatus Methanomethylophilaceae archaeon]